MAKTAAQRQQAYRKSRPVAGENGERRINTWVSTTTALALARLSRRYGVTNRQMLERLIKDADEQVLATLELDSAEWEEYFLRNSLRSNDSASPPASEP
ncbi:MAG: hypothetical protein Q8M09_05380 [Pseudomonadota bacterium]|nr:hypothetical protein [Pseudomonadota bacterium]MDP1903665.1 hypothetical protein [Pseudomonadota bacterium]MDP2354364.1 hypothetical protein [Pseudomonadota bacterium]